MNQELLKEITKDQIKSKWATVLKCMQKFAKATRNVFRFLRAS